MRFRSMDFSDAVLVTVAMLKSLPSSAVSAVILVAHTYFAMRQPYLLVPNCYDVFKLGHGAQHWGPVGKVKVLG